MKTYSTIVGLILVCTQLFAQEGEKFKVVEVEGGVSVPIGNLKSMMNTAPNIGLWFRKPINKNSNYAIGASVNFPKKAAFHYANEDCRSTTKSFSGMVGLKLNKKIVSFNKDEMDISWSSTFGYGFYFYNDIKAREAYEQWPESKKKNDEKPIFNKPFSTIYVGQGLVFRIKDFGLHARYNYAPYSLFSNIITKEFGAQSVTIGLFYRQ